MNRKEWIVFAAGMVVGIGLVLFSGGGPYRMMMTKQGEIIRWNTWTGKAEMRLDILDRWRPMK